MGNQINIYRGNDVSIIFTIIDDETNDNLDFGNFATYNCYMYVRKNSDDDDSKAIIFKEGLITNIHEGVVTFDLVPADTNKVSLKNNVGYITDFILLLNGKRYTVLRTRFTVIN